VGHEIGAEDVVTANVAGTGGTFLVQLDRLNVTQQTIERTIEETVQGDEYALLKMVGPLAGRLFDRPPSRAWYKNSWVWIGVGAVAVAAAVTIPLILLSSSEEGGIPLP
jgi:hypothetical protein